MPARAVPWEDIRNAQIEKARLQLEHQPLLPDAAAGGWWVFSSTGSGESYLVQPKVKKTDRVAHPNQRHGHWWQVLTCTCPAAIKGYMLCWHKAAVFLYWQACKEAKRMEGIGDYLIRDMSPPPAEAPEEAVIPTPVERKAKGPPTPRSARAGKTRPAGKTSASGDRKTRQKTR